LYSTRTVTITVLNSEIQLEENTYICGTLHLDRGVTKEMKGKIKYLK